VEAGLPQRHKGPHLWLRTRPGRSTLYYIKDGRHVESTGCGPDDLRGAEAALARYVATKHAKQAREARGRRIEDTPIADVLLAYGAAKANEVARPVELASRLYRLTEWWGDRMVTEVSSVLCDAYIAERGSLSAARNELADLRAAINHAAKERIIDAAVPVSVPGRLQARERWLTRSEMAALIWAAWSYREVQKGAPTERRSRRHVARFILMGRYTGSRAAAICGASLWPEKGRGWVDLEAGVFYRAAEAEKATNKRKPTIRLPASLLAHIRRWVAVARREYAAGKRKTPPRFVVEWNGNPVRSVRKAFAGARDTAGLGKDVTPHVLRHTVATWLAQSGAEVHDICGFLGMTRETFEAHYGHHCAAHQASVHRALGSRLGRVSSGHDRNMAPSRVAKSQAGSGD
jgi:integrase